MTEVGLQLVPYLGMVAADNGDLALSMIEGILEARQELTAQFLLAYEFNERRNVVELLAVGPEAVFSSAEHHIDRAQHLGDVLWWQPCHALGEKGSIEGNDL